MHRRREKGHFGLPAIVFPAGSIPAALEFKAAKDYKYAENPPSAGFPYILVFDPVDDGGGFRAGQAALWAEQAIAAGDDPRFD